MPSRQSGTGIGWRISSWKIWQLSRFTVYQSCYRLRICAHILAIANGNIPCLLRRTRSSFVISLERAAGPQSWRASDSNEPALGLPSEQSSYWYVRTGILLIFLWWFFRFPTNIPPPQPKGQNAAFFHPRLTVSSNRIGSKFLQCASPIPERDRNALLRLGRVG